MVRAHVLKSTAFGPVGSAPLPYRIDLLRDDGFDLTWTDRHREGWFARPRPTRWIGRLEALTTPMLQTLLGAGQLRRAEVAIAVFESEGHGLALLRGVLGRGPRLVVVSCWLADLASSSSDRRRRLYRRLYRNVDLVTVFSENQVDTLTSRLGIDPERILVVPFGIDLDELASVRTSENGRVAAAGRDLGRDWSTLAAAAAGTTWPIDLVTRPKQAAGLELPDGSCVHGYVERPRYLELLAGASVIVVPTHVLQYPTGQTVLLEAMALGKACVVTDTPAMRDYVVDDETALLVPASDPPALRAAVDRLLADDELRARLGAGARRAAVERFGAAQMWHTIATAARGVAAS